MPLFLVKLQKLNPFPFIKAGNPLSYWGMSFLKKVGIKIFEYIEKKKKKGLGGQFKIRGIVQYDCQAISS